jgi:hypothetical protein
MDLEDSGDIVEFVANILIEALQRTPAGADGVLRFVMELNSRQPRRQRYASRLLLRWLRSLRRLLRYLDLKPDRLETLIDGFLQQASLHGVQLLAAPCNPPASKSPSRG